MTMFTSAAGNDWRDEAEYLRLEMSDDPKKLLQRRNISQIRPVDDTVSNCSTGKFVGVAVLGLLVALGGREKKTLAGNQRPLKWLLSLVGSALPSSSHGNRKRPVSQDWKKKSPGTMAAEAAEARHGGKDNSRKKKKKKKNKRTH